MATAILDFPKAEKGIREGMDEAHLPIPCSYKLKTVLQNSNIFDVCPILVCSICSLPQIK
jgi:hypothetical protein